HRAAVEFSIASIDNQTDTIVAGDHRFKRQPPQFTEAIRKTGGYVDRKWHACVFKNGIGEAQRVAICVVESEADKSFREVTIDHAAVHLVEADELQSRAPQSSHQSSEKLRRHFMQAIRLETVRSQRADVV